MANLIILILIVGLIIFSIGAWVVRMVVREELSHFKNDLIKELRKLDDKKSILPYK